MGNALVHKLQTENEKLRELVAKLERERDGLKQKLAPKRKLRSTDWLEDQILWFVGHDLVGSHKFKQSRGTEVREVRYEKEKPGQARIRQIFQFVKMDYNDQTDRKRVYRQLQKLIKREDIQRVKPGTYRITPKGNRHWLILKDINEANIVLRHEGDVCFHYDPNLKSLAIHALTYSPKVINPIMEHFRLLSQKRGRLPESLYFRGDLDIVEGLSAILFRMTDIYFILKNHQLDKDTTFKMFELIDSIPVFSQLFKNMQ